MRIKNGAKKISSTLLVNSSCRANVQTMKRWDADIGVFLLTSARLEGVSYKKGARIVRQFRSRLGPIIKMSKRNWKFDPGIRSVVPSFYNQFLRYWISSTNDFWKLIRELVKLRVDSNNKSGSENRPNRLTYNNTSRFRLTSFICHKWLTNWRDWQRSLMRWTRSNFS